MRLLVPVLRDRFFRGDCVLGNGPNFSEPTVPGPSFLGASAS